MEVGENSKEGKKNPKDQLGAVWELCGWEHPPDPTGRCCWAWAEHWFSRERRGHTGDCRLGSQPHTLHCVSLRLEERASPSLDEKPSGVLQREAAHSHPHGERPSTIKCDECPICESCGSDLTLSGAAQLSAILKLLLLFRPDFHFQLVFVLAGPGLPDATQMHSQPP